MASQFDDIVRRATDNSERSQPSFMSSSTKAYHKLRVAEMERAQLQHPMYLRTTIPARVQRGMGPKANVHRRTNFDRTIQRNPNNFSQPLNLYKERP